MPTKPLVELSEPPPRTIDRVLQRLRIRQAERYIPVGARVLDVGCGEGALFQATRDRISSGTGIDPAIAAPIDGQRFRFVRGPFPEALPSNTGPFDVITMLAVLEHVPADSLDTWREACARLLVPGGRLIATVPEPAVDRILHVLTRLRLITGMSLHEHHGFNPDAVPTAIGSPPLELITATRFEFGLNNLFVFRVSDPTSRALHG